MFSILFVSIIGSVFSISGHSFVLKNVYESGSSETTHADWGQVAGGSWLSGWLYRKAHNITGSTAGVQTNYPVKINVHYDNGVDFQGEVYLNGKCRADFGDIRFTSSDGTTLLDFWIEEQINSEYAVVWVEIASIPAYPDRTIIYVYYGKDDAATTSNGDDTFISFIDHEAGNLDEWTGQMETASKSASTDHPHTGTYDLKLVPAGGYPKTSGMYYDLPGGIDESHAFRIYIYDVPIKVSWYAEGFVLWDDNDVKAYFEAQGTLDNYQYYAGAEWQDTGIERTAGFHYFEFKVKSTSVIFNVDGTDVAIESDYLAETGLKRIHAHCYRADPNPSWFDDFLIRKWVDPEPTHGGWGDEENEREPPSITSVFGIPSSPNYDEEVTVIATITDDVGVDEASLSYTQDLSWRNVSMNQLDGTYYGTIPAQPCDTLVEYKIYANDTNGNWAVSELYSYTVGDFIAPETRVESQTPPHPQASQTVKVYANVTEPVNASGVEDVFFSYRVNGGSWWNTTMDFNEILGLYESTIPQQQPEDLVEYFVKAVDYAGNVNITEICSYLVTLAGDIDYDFDVDFDDFILLAGAYGASEEDPLYSPEIDLNSDGDIDFDDFIILAGNYGKSI